jgi:hypothetical protein
MSPEAEAVARVAEYRQRARLGEWVTYATGQLDRRNPVAALVRGWELQGRVELREEAGPEGQRWQQFSRLEADFPPGWNDPLPRLPQPPGKRDPEAVGIGWMAHWAGQGDERPEWLRYAASHYRQHLYRLAEAVRSGKLPADAESLLSDAGLVLLTFEQMLDRAPADAFPTHKRLAVVGREITDAEKARDIAAGRKPRRSRMTMERARAEHKAAASVERARAEGGHRLAAIKEAADEHHVAQGGVGARLADRARWRNRPADRALAEAGELAGALQRGGLLQATALGLASELTGLAPAEIRKALKGQ